MAMKKKAVDWRCNEYVESKLPEMIQLAIENFVPLHLK